MRFRVLSYLLLAWACSPSLPSTEPLGRGPLADRGDAGTRAEPRVTAARDAAAPSADAQQGEPSPVAETPAEAEPAADAGPVAEQGAADAAAPTTKAAPVVAGEYQGWDVTTYKMPNVPEVPQRDPNARIRVARGSGDAIEVVIINSANGQDLCTLKGKLKGTTATFDKGQSCFAEEGMMTATLRKGSAKFSGKRLVIDCELDVEVDTGQGTISGEIVYHFEGDRK